MFCGTNTSYTNGLLDVIVYKVDGAGNILWRKNYGGLNNEWASSIEQTVDGGFILAGTSDTYNQSGSFGEYDFLLYKLDEKGGKQWRRNYGGMYGDHGGSAHATVGSGFILAGSTYSFVHGTPGSDCDFLVYRLGFNGKKLWRKNYGGSKIDWGYDIHQVIYY